MRSLRTSKLCSNHEIAYLSVCWYGGPWQKTTRNRYLQAVALEDLLPSKSRLGLIGTGQKKPHRWNVTVPRLGIKGSWE